MKSSFMESAEVSISGNSSMNDSLSFFLCCFILEVIEEHGFVGIKIISGIGIRNGEKFSDY
jgi:hypothetical protein